MIESVVRQPTEAGLQRWKSTRATLLSPPNGITFVPWSDLPCRVPEGVGRESSNEAPVSILGATDMAKKAAKKAAKPSPKKKAAKKAKKR